MKRPAMSGRECAQSTGETQQHMEQSRGPGIGIAAGLAYTGAATGVYLLVAIVVILAGLLLLRTAYLRRSQRS